jgi:hypothetical protein
MSAIPADLEGAYVRSEYGRRGHEISSDHYEWQHPGSLFGDPAQNIRIKVVPSPARRVVPFS